MNLRNSFIHLHPAAKLLITLTLALIGVFVSQILNFAIIRLLNPEKLAEVIVTQDLNSSVLKVIQMVSSIGTFLLPAYIVAYISTPDPAGYLRLNTQRHNKDFFLAALLTLSSLAIINLLAKWNSGLNLPDSMSRLESMIRNMQDTTTEVQERMLDVSNLGGLFFNLIVMAVFPAFTEELFFRGIIQKLIKDWTRNPHTAILITGILFSFAHFQFYGFVPRVFMGVILGYLLFLTNNIWIPIFAHFLNNSIVVISYYFYYRSESKL